MVSVRYIVNDVDAAIAFYTAMLDFKLTSTRRPALPAFCAVTYARTKRLKT